MQNSTRRGTIAAVSASLVVAVAASSATASPSPTVDTDKAAGNIQTVGDRVLPVNQALTVDAAAAYAVDTAGIFGAAESAPAPVVVAEPVVREEAPAARSAERAAVESAPAPAAAESTPAPAAETAPAPAAETAPAASSSGIGNQIVAIARQYVGTPYVYGGATPAGFDCSGFTSYVFAQVGISISRSSAAQRGAGYVVSAAEARPGDLVWWPGHVGIYTGNGQHIAARNPSSPLHESPIYRANPTYIRVAG